MAIDHNQVWDSNGKLLYEEFVEREHLALNQFGVIATLNAVLGLWPLEDAANAVGLSPDDLIAEAQAWAVANEEQTINVD